MRFGLLAVLLLVLAGCTTTQAPCHQGYYHHGHYVAGYSSWNHGYYRYHPGHWTRGYYVYGNC